MKEVTIKLDQDKFNSMLINGTFEGVKYELKEVTIKDDFFKDDYLHKDLVTKSIKAYKQLKEYEYNKRNNNK